MRRRLRAADGLAVSLAIKSVAVALAAAVLKLDALAAIESPWEAERLARALHQRQRAHLHLWQLACMRRQRCGSNTGRSAVHRSLSWGACRGRSRRAGHPRMRVRRVCCGSRRWRRGAFHRSTVPRVWVECGAATMSRLRASISTHGQRGCVSHHEWAHVSHACGTCMQHMRAAS